LKTPLRQPSTQPILSKTTMPEISASEYLNSLLQAYQSAEKIYTQAVSDLVAAEIRRDEASTARDEALQRLEEARAKYGPGNKAANGEQKLNKSNSFSRRKGGPGKSSSFKKKALRQSRSFDRTPRKGESNPPSPPKPPLSRSPSFDDKNRETTKSPIQRSLSDSERGLEPGVTAGNTNGTNEILLSPRAGSKKAPKIFRNGNHKSEEAPKRKSAKLVVGPLAPLDTPFKICDITKGRSRNWMQKNIDCVSLGLVKKFYQAAFGLVTNEKTKEISVHTIVLNDEWNELVTDTSEIQEMYIGKSSDPNAKPSSRDRAALALVKPPQREPIALFFAPKKAQGSNDIHYGGHWKVE